MTLALETAENDLLLEKSNLTDFKILYAAGGLSLKDYEQQQGNVKAKEKRIKEIQLEIDALKEKYQSDADSLEISINQKKSELTDLQADMSNEVRELKASIEQSKKLLFSAEAELKNLTDSIDKASIRNDLLVCDVNRAAIDSIRFNPGDTIDAGSIIAILMDLDSLYVEVGIEEQSILQVHMDSNVQIIPEMDKTKFYTGKVTFVSAIASQRNNETIISIKVSIDNPDKFLMPNSNVKVKILSD